MNIEFTYDNGFSGRLYAVSRTNGVEFQISDKGLMCFHLSPTQTIALTQALVAHVGVEAALPWERVRDKWRRKELDAVKLPLGWLVRSQRGGHPWVLFGDACTPIPTAPEPPDLTAASTDALLDELRRRTEAKS